MASTEGPEKTSVEDLLEKLSASKEGIYSSEAEGDFSATVPTKYLKRRLILP